MNDLKPGPILMLGGGVLLLLSSFLDWGPGTSGFETDAFGLLGILTLLIGVGAAGIGGATAFAPQVKLPSQILGFTIAQFVGALSFSAFIWLFAFQFSEFSEIGISLGWIGAVVAIAGAIVTDMQAEPSSGGSTTTF